MWMKAKDNILTPVQVSVHPFDHVAVCIGCCHFYRGWQIDNELIVRTGIDHFSNRITNLLGVCEFGTSERFRRVLVTDVRIWHCRFKIFANFGSIGCNFRYSQGVHSKDNLPLKRRRRIVEMNYRLFASGDGFKGSVY